MVATGKIKHREMNNEHEATINRYRSVRSTRSEMFVLSFRIASVLELIARRMLLSAFVKRKNTAVPLRVI